MLAFKAAAARAALCVDGRVPSQPRRWRSRLTQRRRSIEANVAADLGEEPTVEYGVHFESLETRRCTVFFSFRISHGNASWPIRRRFRDFARLHSSIRKMLKNSTIEGEVPSLPPKITSRALLYGPHDEQFLAERSEQLQHYLEAVLLRIPSVDQCAPLRTFLCTVDIARMTYDTLLELGDAVGRVASRPAIGHSLIAELPRRERVDDTVDCCIYTNGECSICLADFEESDDVRVLPCGHEYHFECIAQWIPCRNVCCICQAAAIEEPAALTAINEM